LGDLCGDTYGVPIGLGIHFWEFLGGTCGGHLVVLWGALGISIGVPCWFFGSPLVASLAVIWSLWWLPGCSLGGFGGGGFLVVFVVVQLVASWWSSFASWVSFGLFYIVLGECGRLSFHSSSLCSHTWEVVGQHPIVPSIVFLLFCSYLVGFFLVF
jgi:hypothetical protein